MPFSRAKFTFTYCDHRFRRVCKLAQRVCLSVCPHGTSLLTPSGFWWNLIFECVVKSCREDWSTVQIWQVLWLLYIETCVRLWHLTELFLELEMFQIKFVEKIKTHVLCSVSFFLRKSCRLWENERKRGRARHSTDISIMWSFLFAYWISKATDTHSGYVIISLFLTATMITRRLPGIDLCVCCLSCWLIAPWPVLRFKLSCTPLCDCQL